MTTNDNTAPDDRLLIHALVDGELDPASALSLERRIAADPALAAERARAEALRSVLREKIQPLPVVEEGSAGDGAEAEAEDEQAA